MRLRFDKGTLLLDAPIGWPPIANLPYVRWDPRVAAHRAPALEHAALVDAFVRMSVRFSDDVRKPDAPLASWREIDLRPYQAAAVEAWELGGRRGIVALPTGSGKTRVATAIIARSNRPALVIVPTIALMEQWERSLRDHYSGPIGLLGDGHRTVHPLTVATFESAYRNMPVLGDRFALLVVDEAHHFGAGIRDEALEMSTAQLRLGLTGTCPRDGPHIERLARLIGSVAYELALSDLGGWIAPLERRIWTIALTNDERLVYDSSMAIFQAFSREYRREHPHGRWQDFVKTAAKSTAGRRALAAWRSAGRILAYPEEKRSRLGEIVARHRSSRILVFCADNSSAYEIARDHLLMPITCDIDRTERATAFSRFEAGELRGLVSARVLNEGIDLPDADVAVVVSAALGEREHLQRVGRVLRPREDKRAVLYELVAKGTLELSRARRRSRGLDLGKNVRLPHEGTRAHPGVSHGGGPPMASPLDR